MPAEAASSFFPPLCGRAERQPLDNSQGVCCRKVARVTLECPTHSFTSFILSCCCRYSLAIFFLERLLSGEKRPHWSLCSPLLHRSQIISHSPFPLILSLLSSHTHLPSKEVCNIWRKLSAFLIVSMSIVWFKHSIWKLQLLLTESVQLQGLTGPCWSAKLCPPPFL